MRVSKLQRSTNSYPLKSGLAKFGLTVCLLGLLSGCSTSVPFWARHMSTEDVEQAERLAVALDEKYCVHVTGQGAAYGIEGSVEIFKVTGQNASFQDCMNAIIRVPGTVTLIR